MKGWKEDENGENGDRSPGVGKKGKMIPRDVLYQIIALVGLR